MGTTWLSVKRLFNPQDDRLGGIIAVTVVLVVAVSGYLLLTGKAVGYFVSTEAENGTLAGNATVVTDTSASGGKAVEFNSPAVH